MRTDNPTIWKKQKAQEMGGCAHWWSTPCCVPSGLMTECFKCHKTRHVYVDKRTEEQREWLEGGLQ